MSEEKALEAERILENLRYQISALLQSNAEDHKRRLLKENGDLVKNIENLKKSLMNYKCDPVLPIKTDDTSISVDTPSSQNSVKSTAKPSKDGDDATATQEKDKQFEEKSKKTAKTPKAAKPSANPVENAPVDVGRLDFRIGRIIEAEKHPDADSLYVEKIDVGEEQPRTVVSGLVRFIPLEGIVNKLVVVMCNLKPAKMRGVTSQAMVMCASTPEKVELLVPPSNCVPGDLVEVEGFPRIPDAVLNPKKKIFEACAPDLKTSLSGLATYKGVTWKVEGKGEIRSSTLNEVQIK